MSRRKRGRTVGPHLRAALDVLLKAVLLLWAVAAVALAYAFATGYRLEFGDCYEPRQLLAIANLAVAFTGIAVTYRGLVRREAQFLEAGRASMQRFRSHRGGLVGALRVAGVRVARARHTQMQ